MNKFPISKRPKTSHNPQTPKSSKIEENTPSTPHSTSILSSSPYFAQEIAEGDDLRDFDDFPEEVEELDSDIEIISKIPSFSSRIEVRHEFNHVKRDEWTPKESDSVQLQIIQVEDASKETKLKQRNITGHVSPLIRVFGTTRQGASVCVFVHSFFPYLYYACSPSFTDSDLETFKSLLIQNIESKANEPRLEVDIEIVTRQPLMFYRLNPDQYSKFLKITFKLPHLIARAHKLLSMADQTPGFSDLFRQSKLIDTQVYESNITFDLRFMVDKNLVGGGWLTIPAGKYRLIPTNHSSRCGLNISCHADDIISNEDATMAKMNFFNVMVTTLEEGDSKDVKPEEAPEKVIGFISVLMTNDHSVENPKNQTLVLCHSHQDYTPDSPDQNFQVISFESEKEMILAFRDLLLLNDPEVVVGYDVTEHLALIASRAEQLKIKNYNYFGRITTEFTKVGRKQIYSPRWVRQQRRMASTSNREFTTLKMTGRIVLDMRQIIERDERLRSYSFAESVAVLLHHPKQVLTEQTLTQLNQTTQGRSRCIGYCKRDVELCMEMVRRTASFVNYVEMARTTGLNIVDTFQRGQMIRFFSLLYRYCRKVGVVIPALPGKSESQMAEGSYVMMPQQGYYTEETTAVLDFKSLYPSIIIGHNLSYDTMIHLEDAEKLDPKEWEKGMGPEECYFVKSSLKKGIVPCVLEQLIQERRRVRKMMMETTDPMLKVVYNSRQQALKTCANAAYGFTGAPTSKLQMLAIAETTITRGATMLQETISWINDHYMKSNGFPVDAHVVYGDTDSLFVKFPGVNVANAIVLGKRIAKEVSERFPDPIELEFENVYYPLLLVNRKRYAGLSWIKGDEAGEVVAKGVESQRRDSCGILSWMMLQILDILFPKDKDNGDAKISSLDRREIVNRVVEFVKNAVKEMLQGKFDLGEFLISKGLWLGDSYKTTQIHVEVVEKIQKRDPRRRFVDGERVSFVYQVSGSKGYEKGEDPKYVLEKGLELDYPYYLHHQIIPQLSRLLELVLDSTTLNNLWYGDHTKVVAPKTPSKSNGPLSKFFTKTEVANCMNCRAKIASDLALCDRCIPQLGDLYGTYQDTLSMYGEEQARLFAMCRSCQSCPLEVLCENMDCKIFYRRAKIKVDHDKAMERVDRIEKSRDWQLDW